MHQMRQDDATALQHAQPSEDALLAKAIQVLELRQAIHNEEQLQLAYEVSNLQTQKTYDQTFWFDNWKHWKLASIRWIILNQKILHSWG